MEGCGEPQHSRAALFAGLPTPHMNDRKSSGETCGPAKRWGRETRAERGWAELRSPEFRREPPVRLR